MRFASSPVVLFTRDEDRTGGVPLFNVIVKTDEQLPPKASKAAVRADITVNGIGDPAPVVRAGPRSTRCYRLMIEGGSPETADVESGDTVSVELIVLTKPEQRVTARVPAREVSASDLADESGNPAPRYLRAAGCHG